MRVLIFGRAKGVWDEMDKALSMSSFDRLIGVGSAVCDYPGEVSDWVTFHGQMFYKWLLLRQRKGYSKPMYLWTSSRGRRVKEVERKLGVIAIGNNGGSSGKIAYDVAKYLNASKIVLCGIPLTVEGGQYDTGKDWTEAMRFRVPWMTMVDPNLRSMSGWTMEKFGAPTREWLNDGNR